ncbi:MAG: acetylglutamate kinase [Kiritimatiellia bacterium]|jgi:acetylglutamate kinase
MMQRYIEKAETLIEALPYLQAFKGSVAVVKIGGSLMDDVESMDRVLTDIAFLATVGLRPVLVHGGGKAISRSMEKAGVKPVFLNGLRVTDEMAVRVAEEALGGVNDQLVKLLRAKHVAAASVRGEDILLAERKRGVDPSTGAPIDWGFVGVPVAVDPAPVLAVLAAGAVPVVTPLGRDASGQLYNVNADTAAAALAPAVRAEKLAFLSDVPGLLRDPRDPASLVATLRVGEIAALRQAGIAGGGMLPKLDSCAAAIRDGVGKVHLVDGRMPHSLLLEIFTHKGVGTEIIPDEQEK